jgi:glycosyltransferase involved in cell wall biosynthesis
MRRPIAIRTDDDLPASYRVMADAYAATFAAAGFPAVALPGDAPVDGARLVFHNTIGPRFAPIPGVVNVALPAHEWSAYPPRWVDNLNRFDEVWVTSTHVARLLADSGVTAPIRRLPPALADETVPTKNGYAPAIPFRFLSVGEPHFRKGLHLLLAGFADAFEPGEAELIVKSGPGLDLPPTPGVTLIDRRLPPDALASLYAGCDAYVTATLGEGLGLTVIEAAMAGAPVAANLWGGHADLLPPDGCYPIPHVETVQPYCSRPAYYAPGQMCGYSSPEDIAAALRRVVDATPAERAERAAIARRHTIDRFGPSTTAAPIAEALRRLPG